MTVKEIFGLNRELRQLQWVAGREHAENQVMRIEFLNDSGAGNLMPGDLLVIASKLIKNAEEASQTGKFALSAGAAAILLCTEDEARNMLVRVCGQALPVVSVQTSGLNAAVEGVSAALFGEATYSGYILSQFKGELDKTDVHVNFREVLRLLHRYLSYPCEIVRGKQQLCPKKDGACLHAGRELSAEHPEDKTWERGVEEYSYRYFPIQNPMGVSSQLEVALPPGDRLSQLDVRLINCALPHLALSLLLDDGRTKSLYRDKDELFSQAVCGRLFPDKETLAENCYLLDLPYGRRWVVWVMDFSPDFEYLGLVLRRVKEFFEFYGKNVLTAKEGMYTVFAVDYEGILAPRGKPDELFEKLFSYLTHGLASGCIKTGISSYAENASEWPSAYQEACFALETAKRSGRERIFYTEKDYTFRHLLTSLADNSLLKRMYSKTLQPVLEYDRQNSSDLMDTLRQLVACDFNVNIAADSMYFHRNTLYKRIKKITSLLNMDMAKLETRMILQIELELYARFGEWM